jgi:5-oxopent-3-ene-1,2,5-tricarboxylate decarboxylase/2-hydroxyhepta-2,4-diene-1,7-dioate isomerase
VNLVPEIPFERAPWRLSGTVYGVLMNDPAALAALGDAASLPPYKAPPKAPVLYVKPRNTLNGPGVVVALPADAEAFKLGAAIGLVIGRTACAVGQAQALSHLAGCTLVADLSVPHDSFYRPSVRFKARDGSCLIGPRVAAVDPDSLALRVSIDGAVVRGDSPRWQRPAARLIADVSEFMTLRPGDILLLGVAAWAPLVRAGQRFAIEAGALGVLEGRIA